MSSVIVFTGDELALYGFGDEHPFSLERHGAFYQRFIGTGLYEKVQHGRPVMASEEELELFHTPDYVREVQQKSLTGEGYLDCGDTPATRGIYEAAATVVGTSLAAMTGLIEEKYLRAFVPIAGLHHARRDRAAGFCVFNDCGVVIEALRKKHGIRRVAYVDIDAHHGDGVFYSFESDPDLCFVDFHEDGHFLYPGTGRVEETGQGHAAGSKLNIPMPMGANDEMFRRLWPAAEEFIEQARPQFILLQCGADSIEGDPLTHMHYTSQSHAFATERLASLADKYAQGRLLVMGGGGYNLGNLSSAWCAVIDALLSH